MDLPADLQLPLERGAPHWYWLGGRPALDFVNTLRERWWRNVETLVTDDDLSEWLVAAQLTDHAPRAPGQLERARTLREAIDAGVVAVLAGRPVPEAARATIEHELPTLREAFVREPDGTLALRALAPDDPLGLIARDAALMFTPAQSGRIRVCASETCSARFFDRSPAAVRRWCSSKACGNVDKARRYRRRRREEQQ